MRIRALFKSGVVVLLLVTACSTAVAQTSEFKCVALDRSKLMNYFFSSIAAPFATNKSHLILGLLGRPECTGGFVRSIESVGGHVLHTDSQIGYVDASVPREQVLPLSCMAGVQAAQVFIPFDYSQDVPSIPEGELRSLEVRIPVPRVATAFDQDLDSRPYFPAEEADLTSLRSIGDDGGGVRIGLPDDGVDQLHPALQMSKDLEGRMVPKIAAYVLSGSYWDENPAWVRAVPIPPLGANRDFQAFGRTWKSPINVSSNIGMGWFRKRIMFGLPGTKEHLDLSVPVLVDFDSRTAWFDFDGDADFANDSPVRDYEIAQQVGTFGTKSDGPR